MHNLYNLYFVNKNILITRVMGTILNDDKMIYFNAIIVSFYNNGQYDHF